MELFLQQNFKKSKLLDISSKWTKFQSEILSNSNFIIQVWVLIFIPIPENVTSKILHICCAQWCVIQFDFCQENSKRGPDVKENKASTSDYCHILCFQRLLKFTRPCKKIIVNSIPSFKNHALIFFKNEFIVFQIVNLVFFFKSLDSAASISWI